MSLTVETIGHYKTLGKMELAVLQDLGTKSKLGTVNVTVSAATFVENRRLTIGAARGMLQKLSEKRMVIFENRYIANEQAFLPAVGLTLKGLKVLQYQIDLDQSRIDRLSTRVDFSLEPVTT